MGQYDMTLLISTPNNYLSAGISVRKSSDWIRGSPTGVRSPAVAEIFPFVITSKPSLRPTQPPLHYVRWLFPRS
jgi:hypothetical protein